jgi:SAM-dependent methyltransferase
MRAHRDAVIAAFSDERDYEAQSAPYEAADGPDAVDIAFEAVAAGRPDTILDVGCGTGTFAARVRRHVSGEVVGVDLSPRMAELTRDRGVPCLLADAAALPFSSASMDCVIATWTFHYSEDVPRCLAEAARVLKPGGRLVAATLSERNTSELWEIVFGTPAIVLPFSRESGRRQLRRHFATVERFDADGHVRFADWKAVRDYLARTIGGESLAERLPYFEGPFLATKRSTVFVAHR